MPFPPSVAKRLVELFGNEDNRARAERIHFNDVGHGYDPFGLHPDFVALGDTIANFLYQQYFRVRSYDAHHLPATGSAILASNHSGTLPFDGAMLWVDVLRNTDPPRVARAVADYFVPSLPLVGTFFARGGAVGGSRGNARALLEAGELLMIFPEGTPGISKPFRKRYQLQKWRLGHVEMAIRYRAPVIPVGIVGPEEQLPQIARIPVPGPVPFVPISASPVPLPVRYHIHYGEPIDLPSEYPASAADDPVVLHEASNRVKAAVQALLDRGLATRDGVFG